MGSKSKIADSLIKALPEGKRFVDLFGGGFAMSECALRSGKYEGVLYNDFNPLVVNLVMDAIAGKYNFKRFDPKWIDRETFNRERERERRLHQVYLVFWKQWKTILVRKGCGGMEEKSL